MVVANEREPADRTPPLTEDPEAAIVSEMMSDSPSSTTGDTPSALPTSQSQAPRSVKLGTCPL